MSDISKVNLRIKRMWEFTGGDDPTLDAFKNALENLYGHDIVGAPIVHTTEVDPEQRDILNELVQSYLDSPFSTKTGYKVMTNKGFAKFVDTRQLTNAQVVELNKVFKSPVWQKVREQYYHSSEAIVDSVQQMIDAGASGREVKEVLDAFNKSNNSDKNLLSFIDNYLSSL